MAAIMGRGSAVTAMMGWSYGVAVMMGQGSGRTDTLVWQPCCEEVLVQRTF